MATAVIAALILASCNHDDDILQETQSAPSGQSTNAAAPDVVAIERAMAAAPQQQTNSVPWASPTTGSAGVLSYTESRSADGRTCRAFLSSRQSLDGGDTLNGQACAEGDGRWRVNSLNAQ
ncbi:RT0821/Lpp0805 family surface protein [Endobacterium cereale]|uniref:RT0821/Lpp0805 family surface protein n=1 Tax=Endobacterium cereale TaxID=2663029 RepID=UPI00397D905F